MCKGKIRDKSNAFTLVGSELNENKLHMFSELPVSQCKKGNMINLILQKFMILLREVIGPVEMDTL